MLGLVLLIAITLFINLTLESRRQLQNQLDRDLVVARSVLSQVLENREQQLINSASVLTDDFGFKRAVASSDRATIDSVLSNHGKRIDADFMGLVSLQGVNVTSWPALLTVDERFPYPEMIEQVNTDGGLSVLILLNNKLYQMIMLTVDAPEPIAIAMVGFELDSELVTQLKNITRLDTTIQALNNDQLAITVSTLSTAEQQVAFHLMQKNLSLSRFAFRTEAPYISTRFTFLERDDLKIIMTLSKDLAATFADITRLQNNLLLITAVAIIIALLFAALFSRRVARPVTSLSTLAQNIAEGTYTQDIDTQSNSREFNHLASAFKTMQQSIREREEKIRYQAQRDLLTGLFNRYHIDGIMREAFSHKTPFQVVGVNVYGLRGVNDVFGYHSGDVLLQTLAQRLQQLPGSAARLTAGELLWLPEQPQSLDSLVKIKQQLEGIVSSGDVDIKLQISLVLFDCPKDANNTEHLFRRLNIAFDEAHHQQQSILFYNTEYEQRYLRRLTIVTELKKVLNHQQSELSMVYQPKLHLPSQQILAAEALIRWNSHSLGFVSPEEFISIAEQGGLIDQITRWVIERVAKDIASLNERGIELSVAINLSARDVVNPEILTLITDTLNQHSLPVTSFSVEVTESDFVKDTDEAIEHLLAYRQAGFKSAIDDFGTGYSSMEYLKHLPVDALKIDKSFVLTVETDEGDQHIVRTVIELAHKFHLEVIAEGVESQAALAFLSQWGCEWAQGYYIARPMPITALIDWMPEHTHKNWLERI